MARSPGEAPKATCGGTRQGGCVGDSPVWHVIDEGAELKVGGGVLWQRRRMVTGGGRGGLQQCGGGQGGVGGLWRGDSHVEERQGEGEGKGGASLLSGQSREGKLGRLGCTKRSRGGVWGPIMARRNGGGRRSGGAAMRMG
jgi:hypothetical protein